MPKRAYYQADPLADTCPIILDPDLQNLAGQLQPIWVKPATIPLPIRQETAPEAMPLPPEPDRPDFSAVQIYRPSKTIVGNFMASLKTLMRTG